MAQCNSVKTLGDNIRIVSLLNYGAFVAYFSVYYFYQGNGHYFESPNLPVLQQYQINIPFDATDVTVNGYVYNFISDPFLLFSKSYPTADDACFLMWGITFSAHYKEIPCTGPGVIQSILPPVIMLPLEVMNNNCNIILNNSVSCNKCMENQLDYSENKNCNTHEI